ncbi:uncharacterized protein EDB93DRAFT_644759 [Suillus bovinus]|uniref:uncharacterized protein n=1 Tax=Suillus bovinus TaxID=48563 RepID=UPI001B87DB3B|nr:uncharacterized protein EDB93DRAFT_644759 [Suillus bovinus]KAG2140909.1 hypothetical protein EDB93DRAFT_644759 [Suillus bovinus]
MSQNPFSLQLGQMPGRDPRRLAIQSSLLYLDKLDLRVREEIQATRRQFLELLYNPQSNVTMGNLDGYDSILESQAELNELSTVVDNVLSMSFDALRKRFFVQQPAPHSTFFGVMGGPSEGANTHFGQPPQGQFPGSAFGFANYGPVPQPFLPQPQYSGTFPVIYDPHGPQPLLQGAYPVGQDTMQVPADPTEGNVEFPKDLLIDDFCVPSTELLVIEPEVVATRIRPRHDGFPRQVFDPKDIACLSSPMTLLNDVCINGCAAILYSQFKLPTVDCAILTTYDLPRVRTNASDELIWRNISWTSYWEKNVWILPIHRPSYDHWVICIIYFQTNELHLFDSLAEQESWEDDVKDIKKLVGRFLAIARIKRHGGVQIEPEDWQVRTLNVNPCQSNGYDCGLWILAAMIAVLRGRHVTGLHENQMSALRHYLHSLVFSIPSIPPGT